MTEKWNESCYISESNWEHQITGKSQNEIHESINYPNLPKHESPRRCLLYCTQKWTSASVSGRNLHRSNKILNADVEHAACYMLLL